MLFQIDETSIAGFRELNECPRLFVGALLFLGWLLLHSRMKERRGRYLFAHESDPERPVPKVNNAHDRAVKESKVAPFRLYDCRHTFATRAI